MCMVDYKSKLGGPRLVWLVLELYVGGLSPLSSCISTLFNILLYRASTLPYPQDHFTMATSIYKTPAPEVPPGVPYHVDEKTPTLFTPITIRSLTLPNRIFVAPMCTYSSHNGALQDFHLVHLGAYATRGASLTIVEATAVQPRGRITPGCPGLWSDEQIPALKKVADYVHGQGHKIGVQLAHAGRKASTLPPWEAEALVGRGRAIVCSNDRGGWEGDVWGPSEQPYGPGCVEKVHEMSVDEIKQTVQDFVSAAKRAVAAGIDVIEVSHNSHLRSRFRVL